MKFIQPQLKKGKNKMNTTERKLRKTIRGIIKETLDLSEADRRPGHSMNYPAPEGEEGNPEQKLVTKIRELAWTDTLLQQINTSQEMKDLITLFVNFFAEKNSMEPGQEMTAIKASLRDFLKGGVGDATTASIRPGDPDETASFAQDIEIPENRTVKENRTNIKKNLLKQVRKRKNA